MMFQSTKYQGIDTIGGNHLDVGAASLATFGVTYIYSPIILLYIQFY